MDPQTVLHMHCLGTEQNNSIKSFKHYIPLCTQFLTWMKWFQHQQLGAVAIYLQMVAEHSSTASPHVSKTISIY